MKIFLLLVASIATLTLAGCAQGPLVSDEDYKAMKGPAPFSPDPTVVLPQSSGTLNPGY
jgi:hypothetical protein